MKNKILFLLDMEWLHFGIAKFIIDALPCESFAIIDIDYNSKHFYKNQKIIRFQKYWFYRDFLQNGVKTPDLEFLKKMEKKYKINLWKIALSERFFYQYNPYHIFSAIEVQAILQNEIQLFDEVLERIKPDYLVTKLTDSHQSDLLLSMCRAKGIRILMMASTRLHNRYAIFDEYDKFDTEVSGNINDKKRSIEELKNIVDKHSKSKALKSTYTKTESPITRTKKYLKYLKLLDSTTTDYYAHLGKNRFSVISQWMFFKRWYRRKFIDKKFLSNPEIKKPFVYFPLHVEPERQLLMVAPFFDDQLEIIRNIARSLPIDYRLIVKEHWMMEPRGWRDKSYYEQILKIPNVDLVHPSFDGEVLMKHSSLVVTISGTSGFEATFYNKPVITFADNSYSTLPSVYRIRAIEELPEIIRSVINEKVDFSALDSHVRIIEQNSFEIDLRQLGIDFKNHFGLNVNTIKSEIDIPKMEKFLEEHKNEFSKIAEEHVKKIKKYTKLKD